MKTRKTYHFMGVFQHPVPCDINIKIQAYSKEQAILLLAIKLEKRYKIYPNKLVELIKKSKLIIKEEK